MKVLLSRGLWRILIRGKHKLSLLAIFVPLFAALYAIGYIDVAGAEGSITLSPSAGPPGSAVTVTGSGFGNNTSVTILVDNAVQANATADASGTFSIPVTMPPTSSNGNHIITANDGVSSTEATFTVTLPQLTLSPDNGIAGTSVTVSGTGFSANSAVTVKFATITLATTPESITTTPSGTFSATVTIPTGIAASVYNISVADTSGRTGSAVFSVAQYVAPPSTTASITLTSTTVLPGSTVTVIGSGFLQNNKITIMLDDAPISDLTTGGAGVFSATVTVPVTSSSYYHVITASDGVNSATATFNAPLPAVSLSPERGIPGTAVSITASNFDFHKRIYIRFDGDTIDTLSAAPPSVTWSQYGKYIYIPGAATAGTHFISITDGILTVPMIFEVLQLASPSITLSTGSAPAGTSIVVRGDGFVANTPIVIKLDSRTLAAIPTDIITNVSGSFTATATIPTGTSIDTYTISAVDASGRTGSELFTTIKAGALTLSSSSAIVGSTITVYGSEFNPNSPVTLKLDSLPLVTDPASVVTSSTGTFTATISIPTGLAGTKTISAIDSTGRPASAIFTAMKNPVVAVSPSSGTRSGIISVTGSDFIPNSSLTIKLDSAILTVTKADSLGNLGVSATLPRDASFGDHTISVIDSMGGASSTRLTVIKTGTVTLSAETGRVGTVVTISGSEYNPKTAVTIMFDSAIIETAKTDATGSFSTNIIIPTKTQDGGHTINVVDAEGRTGLASFSVREPGFITITPTTGPPGTEVTISGWNYINGTKITINFGSQFSSDHVGTYPKELFGSALGRFIGKFRIPLNHTEGTFPVYAWDSTGRLGSALFTVASEGLALSLPNNNGKGGTVSMEGWGFPARGNVTITFDGEAMHTTPLKIITTRTGTFKASFVVPGNAPNGDHLIQAESRGIITNATLTLKRNYIDDRYGILISAFPQKYDFAVGETAEISGKVLALNNGLPLLLRIINPNGAACNVQQLYLDSNMDFEAEPIKLEGKLCSIEGEYKITAFYGKGKSLTKFDVAGFGDELTGGSAEVMNGQKVSKILRYDNKYTVDLDWANNAVRVRNNVNQTITLYLMFAEFDANEVTKKLSYNEITLGPFEHDYVVAPFVPQIIDGRPDGYLHVFAWTSLNDPTPLHPGLYVPY